MYIPIDAPKVTISIDSPNIATPNSNYKYPINQIIAREISSNLSLYIK